MFARSYANYYDLFNSDKPYKKEVDFVYRWAGKPESILDIGCGTANYWRYYPKKTVMAGIDKSKHMIVSKGVDFGDVTKFDFKNYMKFDCATALFDVINYIPKQDWWKRLPIKKGGSFIFDVLDSKKAEEDGFRKTLREIGGICRSITPSKRYGKSVDLLIELFDEAGKFCQEKHRLYMYSSEDIKRFCGRQFEIVEVKETKSWQTWYKCRRK